MIKSVLYYQLSRDCEQQSEYVTSLSNTFEPYEIKTSKTRDGALIASIMDGNIRDTPAMKGDRVWEQEVLQTLESMHQKIFKKIIFLWVMTR